MPRPATRPPLAAPIPVEAGWYDRLAYETLILAVADGKAGSQSAREWLAGEGLEWAAALSPDRVGAVLPDLLSEWAREEERRERRERAERERSAAVYRRLMQGEGRKQ